jgi:hypothetical protein
LASVGTMHADKSVVQLDVARTGDFRVCRVVVLFVGSSEGRRYESRREYIQPNVQVVEHGSRQIRGRLSGVLRSMHPTSINLEALIQKSIVLSSTKGAHRAPAVPGIMVV